MSFKSKGTYRVFGRGSVLVGESKTMKAAKGMIPKGIRWPNLGAQQCNADGQAIAPWTWWSDGDYRIELHGTEDDPFPSPYPVLRF